MASITGEQVQCAKTGDFCVDSGQRDPQSGSCSWTRKLCVTCEKTATEIVKISVQSNGLPAKCFWTETRALREENIDFTVIFNPTSQTSSFTQSSASFYFDELCDSTNVNTSKTSSGSLTSHAINSN